MKEVLKEKRKAARKNNVREISPYVHLMRNLRILRSYPLTTPLAQKMQDASEFHGWTIFLNNAHTLIHVMPNDGGGYWRERVARPPGKGEKFAKLKMYSDEELLLHMVVFLAKYINI